MFRTIIKQIVLPLFLLAITGCSSMLYQPTHVLYYDPERIHLTPEQISFSSEDGVNLRGWYFHGTQEKPKALVVFFHGNAENLTSHYLALAWLTQQPFDYFIFDYRGYGLSDGVPSPEGTLEDGKAALRWAFKKTSGKVPLVVFGQSLGGAVAMRTVIEMKKEIPISLVVADSTFLSYEAAGRSVLSQHWLTWPLQPIANLLLDDQYAPGKRVSEISPIPLIVMHGDQDQMINFSLGEEIFEKAGAPKEFWRVPGGHHIDGLRRKDPTFRDRLLNRLMNLEVPGGAAR